MSEWWTYRLSDFLMFSPRTYARLFELYNAQVWPGQLLALAIGLALVLLATRRDTWAPRAAGALLAAGWLLVAVAFHWQRYAAIHWGATGFAAAFALQVLLLLIVPAFGGAVRMRQGRGAARTVGLGLMLAAVAVHPLLGLLLGRPIAQAEVFGLAPDPTAIATLGWLVLLEPQSDDRPTGRRAARVAWRLLWFVPLAWCVIGAATLAAMQSPTAPLMPVAALLALAFSLPSASRRR
jgi:hypothetical protein